MVNVSLRFVNAENINALLKILPKPSSLINQSFPTNNHTKNANVNVKNLKGSVVVNANTPIKKNNTSTNKDTMILMQFKQFIN